MLELTCPPKHAVPVDLDDLIAPRVGAEVIVIHHVEHSKVSNGM